jgi:uncharacterized membrane protein
MSDPLTDLINDVQHNGVRWVTVITVYAMFRKERRNHLLNKRDAANFENQLEIMQVLGVGDKWKDGPKFGLKTTDLLNLRRFFLLSCKETIQNPRRKTKMNSQNINYATLIPTILGAAKLILQTFGIEIPDTVVNEIVNGAAAVGTIIGIFMAHRKQVLVQAPVPSDPNKFIQG